MPRRLDDSLDDSLFDREEAQRRKQERAEMVAAGEERLAQEAVQDAAAAARVEAFTRDATRAMILAEYQHARVEPRPGTLVSLALLMQLGWRIEDTRDGRQLVAPPKPEPREGPTDADSLPRGKESGR